MVAAQRLKARRARLLATGSVLVLSLACMRPAGAEVITDGTLGPAVALPGPNVTIPAELGQTRGGNLFHSFQRFNVDTGGRVAFTGPGGIRNVVGRVTGGERSAINGILASEIEGADLYLINPAGILFGPGAQLDVKGAFHASTADQLNFADGAVFSALDLAGSTLTVAEPQSFGFLGANVGRIDVLGGALIVRSGDTLSLTAGEIGLIGARLANAPVPPLPAGTTIALAAQRTAGTVPVDSAAPAQARDGDIVIAASYAGNETFVGAVGSDGGRIKIEAGNLVIDGGQIFAANPGSYDATGGIDIGARTLLLQTRPTIQGQSGAIATSTSGDGRAAPVRLDVTDSIDIVGGTVLSAALFAAGGSGSVSLTTGRLTMNGGQVGTPRLTTGQGTSDRTEIVASQSIFLTGGASVFSGSLGDDQAGTVTVRSGGPITLEGDSRITASTLGAGPGGAVTVAAQSLTVDGGRISSSTYTGGGAAGSVTIDVVDAVQLTNGGQIVSTTLGAGAGGTVTIDAATFTASGGSLAGGVLSQSGVRTAAEQGSTGNAGSIVIGVTDSLSLAGGGQLISSTFGPGRGGDIAVTAPDVSISGAYTFTGGLRLSSIQASGAYGSQGQGGSIRIAADSLNVTDGGLIVSGTYGQGDGGAVRIDAGAMTVSGAFPFGDGGLVSAVRASSASISTGDAGSIAIAADTLSLLNGGQIGSSTYGVGDGGLVALDVGTLDARGSFAAAAGIAVSGLRTAAEQGSTGDAGSIEVTADQVSLRGGAQIVSGTLGPGSGGQITVDAGSFTASGGITSAFGTFTSAIQASTTGTGTAGAINLTADSLDLRQGGQIVSGTFAGGDGGTIAIDVGTLTADGVFAFPGGAFVSGVLASAAPGSTGGAGSIRVFADSAALASGAQIASSTLGAGDAGAVRVAASQSVTVDGASINTTSTASGRGGDVVVSGPRVTVEGQGEIAASGFGTGPAGSVTVRADRLEVQDAGIRTAGTGAEGGRITATANERIYLRRADVTSSGIEPAEGASVISLSAPQIVLNASTVTSLTGAGQPLAGSGEASLLGDVTVISADSTVAGSSSVVISGLQTNLGSDLQLAPAGFLDVSRLLRESCAATGAGPRSTFTRGGRGGLPPSPDRPLPSAGADEPSGGERAGISLFVDVCAGRLVQETNS